jgi:hypothetical protein
MNVVVEKNKIVEESIPVKACACGGIHKTSYINLNVGVH